MVSAKRGVIPFKNYKSRQDETVTIKDEMGNPIVIKKYGSLTWEENQQLKELTTQLQNDPKNISQFEYKMLATAILLKSRLGLNEKATPKEIFMYPDGTKFSGFFIEEIYSFFHKEITNDGKITSEMQVMPWEEEEAAKKKVMRMMALENPYIGAIYGGSSDTTSLQKNGSTKTISSTAP